MDANSLETRIPPAPARPPAAYLGHQIMAEYYQCPPELLTDCDAIAALMNDAARACGATIVESVFHRFNPHGVSGVVIIAESHLAIHTWPEYGYAAVDVFTCGDTITPEEAVAFLAIALKAEHHSFTGVNRGNAKLLLAGRSPSIPT